MSVRHIGRDDLLYPAALRGVWANEAPGTLAALGALDILNDRKLGFFCSVKCPGSLILRTYDLARSLRDGGVTVIGGFHSPMEKECLALLLKGAQSVIVCPARSIERMRLPADWKNAVEEGRLLLLSPFKPRRPTAELARRRNEFVAALADVVMIAHARPGGKTESFCRQVLDWGRPILTLDDPANSGLVELGARAVGPEHVPDVMRSAGS